MNAEEFKTVVQRNIEAFRQQLTNMGVKKKALEDMCAGFSDGAWAIYRAAIIHGVEKGG
jgi:hypothetical protein